jgi:hypothetical protein
MPPAFNINRHDFSEFFDNKPGAPDKFVVAQLTDAERILFGVERHELWLSRLSLDEHKARHPEVGMEDYLMIPEIVRHGSIFKFRKKRSHTALSQQLPFLLMLCRRP